MLKTYQKIKICNSLGSKQNNYEKKKCFNKKWIFFWNFILVFMHYSLPFPLIMQHLKTVGFLRHFKQKQKFFWKFLFLRIQLKIVSSDFTIILSFSRCLKISWASKIINQSIHRNKLKINQKNNKIIDKIKLSTITNQSI